MSVCRICESKLLPVPGAVITLPQILVSAANLVITLLAGGNILTDFIGAIASVMG